MQDITNKYKPQLNAPAPKNWMSDIGKISNTPKLPMGKSTDSLWGGLKAGASKFMGKAGDEMKWLNQDMTSGLTDLAGKAGAGIGVGGMIDMASGVVDSVAGAVGLKGAEVSTAGDGFLDMASSLPLELIPGFGTIAKGGLKALSLVNKYAGASSHKQGTDLDMGIIGYNTDINENAGKKYSLLGRSARKKTNILTDSYDRQNLAKYASSQLQKQNSMASQNATQHTAEKNRMKLLGGYGTNVLSARIGTKIPPVNLRKIVNKACYKHQRGSVINRPDIKSINKLDIKPIKSTAGSTDFSNIISKALKSRDEKLKAPETFEEYRLRIGKLNQNFLVDDPSYNLKGAYEAKLEPTLHEDGTYHLGSRDTNTGKIFKLPTHHSFEQTLAADKEAGYVMYLKDGELYSAPKEQVSSSDREAAEQFIRKAMSKSYKDGGLLNKTDREEVIEEVVEEKKNVIPEGAFHSRKNNIHEDYAEHVTKKGIPVITKDKEGKVTQHAEVERNDIIFHKEATDTMETLYEKFKKADTQKIKDEIMIECGKYIADQILVNTDDRTGIIETIE